MDEWEGFRFCPPDDVTVGLHLYCKLKGIKLLANEFINEINIYNFDPSELRFQSKVNLRDFVWYFITPVEKTPEDGKDVQQNRRTRTGYWKITGQRKKIYDLWGRWSKNRGQIGYKKILSFNKGFTPKAGHSDWAMHEYHNTMLPPNMRTHVICRVEYKGKDKTFLLDNASEPNPAFVHHLTNSADSGGYVVDQSVPGNLGSANTLYEYDPANQMSQSVQGNWGSSGQLSENEPANQMQHFSENFNTQEQVHFTSNNNEIPMLPDKDIEEIFQFLFNNEEQNSYTYMQENYNEYRPKDPVTRVFDDFNSDSDNESTLFGDTSSSEDSAGNPNELCSSPIPPLSTIDQHPTSELQTTYESSEEVKMGLQGKEKVKSELECKMVEDSCIKKTLATKRSKQSWLIVKDEKIEKKSCKTPKWIYLRARTVIIAVFLFLSIIAWTTLLR